MVSVTPWVDEKPWLYRLCETGLSQFFIDRRASEFGDSLEHIAAQAETGRPTLWVLEDHAWTFDPAEIGFIIGKEIYQAHPEKSLHFLAKESLCLGPLAYLQNVRAGMSRFKRSDLIISSLSPLVVQGGAFPVNRTSPRQKLIRIGEENVNYHDFAMHLMKNGQDVAWYLTGTRGGDGDKTAKLGAAWFFLDLAYADFIRKHPEEGDWQRHLEDYSLPYDLFCVGFTYWPGPKPEGFKSALGICADSGPLDILEAARQYIGFILLNQPKQKKEAVRTANNLLVARLGDYETEGSLLYQARLRAQSAFASKSSA